MVNLSSASCDTISSPVDLHIPIKLISQSRWQRQWWWWYNRHHHSEEVHSFKLTRSEAFRLHDFWSFLPLEFFGLENEWSDGLALVPLFIVVGLVFGSAFTGATCWHYIQSLIICQLINLQDIRLQVLSPYCHPTPANCSKFSFFFENLFPLHPPAVPAFTN